VRWPNFCNFYKLLLQPPDSELHNQIKDQMLNIALSNETDLSEFSLQTFYGIHKEALITCYSQTEHLKQGFFRISKVCAYEIESMEP
jgi:hypothetical protein